MSGKQETQVVGGVPSNILGMLADLLHKLQHGSMTVKELELFLKRQNPFVITDIRSEWQEFYRKYFRLSTDFSEVAIPEDPGGFDRVIFIPQGLTFAQVIKALRKQFQVSLYIEELDKEVTNNVRTPNQSYAIRLRERQEADEELKSTSADQLKRQGINCITLLERLVYELKYYSETNEHLDIINWTLCTGSRDSGGDVPRVYWDSDSCKLRVHWYDPGLANDYLRARQAVS